MSTEYRLLILFVTHPNKVFSRMEIMDKVWGDESDAATNVVDVYVIIFAKNFSNLAILTKIKPAFSLRNEVVSVYLICGCKLKKQHRRLYHHSIFLVHSY